MSIDQNSKKGADMMEKVNVDSRIGSNIKYIRENFKFTQEQVADYIGVSRPTITHYENGERRVPINQLEKLSDLFGVQMHELLEADMDNLAADIAIAFRADQILEGDMEQIASFKRIVKNYQKLKSMKDEQA